MASKKQILNIARSFLGLKESDGSFMKILNIYNNHKPLARGYKLNKNDEWCACTVSAIFIKANAVNLLGGTECSCNKFIEIFKKKGIWIEDGRKTPKAGDIILYNWDDSTQANDGPADHIGIVEKVSGGYITAIEGNKNEVCARRVMPLKWGYIRGFARPKYPIIPISKPSVSKPKKTINTIAKEVIDGKWGSGDERKEKITKAGYNYKKVQEEVNKLLAIKKKSHKKSVSAIAQEVVTGKWGFGEERKQKLEKAGYNYKAVQREVNKILSK